MDETIKIEIETLERNAKDSSTISSLLHTLRSFPFILSSHDLVSCFQSWRNSHFSFVQSILLEVFPRWHFALTLEEWKKEFEPLIPPLPSSLLALASALVVRDSGKDAEFVEETLIQEKKSKRFGRIQTSGGAKKDQEEIHLFVIEMFKQWSENKSANENGFVRACSLLDDEHDPVFCDDVIRALVSIPDRIASLAAQDESCVAVHMNTDEDQSLSPNIFCADIFKCMLQCDVSLSDSLVENIFIHATQRGCGDGILDTSFSFTPVKFARFKTYLADLSRHLKEDEPEKEEEEERNLHTTLDEEKSMIFMLKHLSGGIRSLNVRKFLISLNRSLFFSSFISYYVLHFVVQSGRKKLKTPFEMVETPERMMNRLWNGLVMHDIRTMESGFRCFIRGLRLCGDHTKAICHIASTMLHSLLSTWSHSEFVSSHSIDENNQLTWCLLMWMHWFGKECDECKKSINTRMRDVFEGVHVRMDHMDHTIRKMGMVVAKITSMIISPDHVVDFDENDLGEWSKIDYDENFFDQFDDYISSQKPEDSEQSYAKEEMIVENMDGTHKNVSNEDTYDASLFDKTGHRTISASFFRDRTLEDSHDDDFDDDDFDDVADDGERDKQIDGKLSKETRDDLLHFETMNEGDEVDAEDEFVPYDLDDDLSDLDEIKAPRYLRTCLKMLQDSQHPQDVSVGMKHFASVLEKDHDDLEEIVPDVADVILHAVNTMEEDEFDFNRHQALITLMKLAPSVALPNLCDRVLEGNQKTGFSSRMQILQAMDDGMDHIVEGARDRSFVPRFFVALLLCVQSHDDPEILARVLRTLAHVLHIAQNLPESGHMSHEMMLRLRDSVIVNHSSHLVRLGTLLCLVRATRILGKLDRLNDPQYHSPILPWIEKMMSHDPDHVCRDLAAACLHQIMQGRSGSM